MDKTVDAVVIGAGIGGISAAAHLARTGGVGCGLRTAGNRGREGAGVAQGRVPV